MPWGLELANLRGVRAGTGSGWGLRLLGWGSLPRDPKAGHPHKHLSLSDL